VIRQLRFRAGSITKSFTATVVLQLVAEGRLELEQSVEHSLPGKVPNGEGISVRHLLNHTSGLFNYVRAPRVAEPYFVDHDYSYYHPAEDLLRYAVETPPQFEPGSGYGYSNTNYPRGATTATHLATRRSRSTAKMARGRRWSPSRATGGRTRGRPFPR